MPQYAIKVSVIIVCYNYGRFIKTSLAAIKQQSFKDYEIVLVDNGSSDDSRAIMQAFCRDNPQLRTTLVPIETNEGLPKGRNAGLDAAKGEYVIFNDADDWMEPECLKELVEKADRQMLDIVVGNRFNVFEDGRKVITNLGEDINKWMISCLQCNLIRRSVFTQHGVRFPDGVFYEDFVVLCFIENWAKSAATCVAPLYNMRFHDTSVTGMVKGLTVELTAQRFKTTLESVALLKNSLESEFDRTMFQYKLIMFYYACVMTGKFSSYPQMLQLYRLLHADMQRFFPHYTKNQNIRLFGKNYHYGHFKRNVWILSRAEKLDNLLRRPFFVGLILRVYMQALTKGVYKRK